MGVGDMSKTTEITVGALDTKEVKVKRNPWRPRKFTNPDDMFDVGMTYIEDTLAKKEPLTVCGLALALDTTRVVLLDYASGKYDEKDKYFSYPIKRLKEIVENGYEKLLHHGKPVGGIFALKNFGWRDTQHIEQTNKTDEPTAEELEKIKNKYNLND